MSNSVWPHRRQPTRPTHPWDSPGKNTGMGCHFLLQFMKVKRESEVAQSCPTLSDPMDCSLPGFSIHGIFQARVLEWGALSTCISHIIMVILFFGPCMFIYTHSATTFPMDKMIAVFYTVGTPLINPLTYTLRNAAATAAKSLQSCPTLYDPIDGSPPGSPVSGILQARTLEWVAISSSNTWKWKVKVKLFRCVRLLVTPGTAAYWASLSKGFSRQEYWSGVPLPSPHLEGLDIIQYWGYLEERKWKWKFSIMSDSETPWTVACQAPLSMGILQARILEWVAISFSRGSSQPRNEPRSPTLPGVSTIWATRISLAGVDRGLIQWLMFLEEEEIRTQTCRGKTCREDGHLQCKEEAQNKSIFDQYFGLRFIISRNFEKKVFCLHFFFQVASLSNEYKDPTQSERALVEVGWGSKYMQGMNTRGQKSREPS